MPGKQSSKKRDSNIKLAIYGGGMGYWGAFNPNVLKTDRMIGGAECAMIHISHGLAKLGYSVTVFYSEVEEPGEYDGVLWKNASDYDPRECYDVVLCWDLTSDGVGIFRYQPCAHLRVLELQCNHPGIMPEHGVDWVTPKSEWHKQTIRAFNPTIPDDHCYIMPNGVKLARYAKSRERIPGRVIWCSSPDRGLHHVLRIWPRIRKEVPDASLHVFYDFDRNFELSKWAMNRQTANIWYIKSHLGLPGVVHRQGVGQQTIAREQKQAMLLAYPLDPPQPCEGFSISILECLAAGTPVVASDADCIPELWGDAVMMLPRPIDDDQWADAIVKLLTKEKLRKFYSGKGKELASRYSWTLSVRRWDNFLREKLKEAKAA